MKFRKKQAKLLKKKFDSSLVYNGKYIITKIKVYNKKANANFHCNKMPNKNLECVCLSVILLDSVYKKYNKYYPQVFLEECKYVVKEKNIHNYIIDDVEIYSDSDEGDLLEKILTNKKILMKKLWKKFRWKKVSVKKIKYKYF